MESALQQDDEPIGSVEEILEVQRDTNRQLKEVSKGFWPINLKLSWGLVFTILFGVTATLNQIGLLGKPLFWGEAKTLERNIQRAERAINLNCDLQETSIRSLALAEEANFINKPKLRERALGLAILANLTLDEADIVQEIWAEAKSEGLTPKSSISIVKIQSKSDHYKDLNKSLKQITPKYAAENVILGAPAYRVANRFSDNPKAIQILTETGNPARRTMYSTYFADKDNKDVKLPSWSETEKALQSNVLCRTNKFWMVNVWVRHHGSNIELITPAIPYVERLARTELEVSYSKSTLGDFAYRSGDFTKALSEFEGFSESSFVDNDTKFMVARRKAQSKMVLAQRCYKDTEQLVDLALLTGKVNSNSKALARLVERCIDDWSGQDKAVELYDKIVEAVPSLHEKDVAHLICNALNDVGPEEFQQRQVCKDIQAASIAELPYKQAEAKVIWAYRGGDYQATLRLIDEIFNEPRFELSEWSVAYLKARRGLSNFYLENYDIAKNDILASLKFYTVSDGRFTQWQTTLNRHLLLIYTLEGNFTEVIKIADQLWDAVKEYGNDYDKVTALRYVSTVYLDSGRAEESYEYSLKWAELSQKWTDQNEYFDAMASIGNRQIRLGRTDGIQNYLEEINDTRLSDYGAWLKEIYLLVPHYAENKYDLVDSRLSKLVQSPLALREHSYDISELIASLVFDAERYDKTRLRSIDPVCYRIDAPSDRLNSAICEARYSEKSDFAIFKELNEALDEAREEGWIINDVNAGLGKYMKCFSKIIGETDEIYYQKFRGCIAYLKQGVSRTGQVGLNESLTEKFDRQAASLGLPPL